MSVDRAWATDLGWEPKELVAVSRLSEARERLAVLRGQVAEIRDIIRLGVRPQDANAIRDELLAYRDREADLVREIAELEGGDEGSAGVREPRHPRPLPIQDAGQVPIPTDEGFQLIRLL
jgi:hypothetical protein